MEQVKRNSKYRKILIIITLFAVLQMIYIFWQKPYIAVGDESLYKAIALDLFKGRPLSSVHYPVLYPALIAPGLFWKENFLNAMLCINVFAKCVGLFVIYVLLRKIFSEKKAAVAALIIAFTPIYFLYSRLLLAENLACILLMINVLYHVVFRRDLKGENAGRKLFLTAGAALLSLSLFWTKYLMLVLLPVFCLYWCGGRLGKDKRDKKQWISFIGDGILYTGVVVLLILLYAWIYAGAAQTEFSFAVLKLTMGLGIGSGPESVGYVFMPQAKWLISYFLYALLGIAVMLPWIMISAKKVQIRKSGG